MSGPQRLTPQQLGASIRKNRLFHKVETTYGTDEKPHTPPLNGPDLDAALTQLWRCHTEGRWLRCNDGAQLVIRQIKHVDDGKGLDAHVSVEQHHNGTRITADVKLAALVQSLDANVPGCRT